MVVGNPLTAGIPCQSDELPFDSFVNKPGPQQAPGLSAVGRAKSASLVFLTNRHRTAEEVRRHLEARFSGEVADLVLHWLEERGLVNDAAFARDWRERRERRRPSGEGQVRRELLGLGIAPEVAERALQGYDSAANARQAARTWLAKHRINDGTDYAKLRRRIWGYLERRGFESELIGQTLREVLAELPDTLDGGVDPEGQKEQPPDV